MFIYMICFFFLILPSDNCVLNVCTVFLMKALGLCNNLGCDNFPVRIDLLFVHHCNTKRKKIVYSLLFSFHRNIIQSFNGHMQMIKHLWMDARFTIILPGNRNRISNNQFIIPLYAFCLDRVNIFVQFSKTMNIFFSTTFSAYSNANDIQNGSSLDWID